MEKVIKKLKDDKHYYGEFGKKYLSNSDIGALIDNPSSFHAPKSQSLPFLYGTAFHEMVMFGKSDSMDFIESSTRTTKIYKQHILDSGKEIVLLQKEADEIQRMVDMFKSNENIKEVLDTKNIQFEVPAVGFLTDNNLPWKGKADIITDDFVYDIKTSASLKSFFRSSKSYNYDSQAFIYSKLFQKPMRFLVIEKGSGLIGIFDTSDEAYDNGYYKVESAESQFLKYFVNKEEDVKNFTKYGEI
jgi:hypothetical protein